MQAPVALCVDEQGIRNPELLGLDGENLGAQKWLRLFSSGQVMRESLLADLDVREVWVASCEDVTPINLAATLKADDEFRRVHLITCDELSGSFATRLRTAGLDEPLSQQAFVRRYMQRKREFQGARTGSESVPKEYVGSKFAASIWEFPLQEQGLQKGKAFVLPVISGSGGSGKSTVSVLLAHVAQRMGFNTLLIDLDLQFGDVNRLAGVPDALCIDDVLEDPLGISRLKPRGQMPAVLAAPRRLEDSERVIAAIPQLIASLSQGYDVVIANTGAFWGEQHALLLESASRVLFLIDQRPSSLRACHRALDLCSRCGIASGQFVFAVNKCTKRATFTSVDVSCSLNGSYSIELADGGKDVEDLIGAGLPTELIDDGNALCASVEKALRELLPSSDIAGVVPVSYKRAGWAPFKRRGVREGGLS